MTCGSFGSTGGRGALTAKEAYPSGSAQVRFLVISQLEVRDQVVPDEFRPMGLCGATAEPTLGSACYLCESIDRP